MKVKGIIDYDTKSYKEPVMTILTTECTMKCDKCKNRYLLDKENKDFTKEEICEKYLQDNRTKAVVISGLEPFDTELDLVPFIHCLRHSYHCDDPIIIYTGYTEEELEAGYRAKSTSRKVEENIFSVLKSYSNIIIKFGRYIPAKQQHFDEVLGINLSSDNQYARKIS